MGKQEVKDGDVYNVRTNFRDELLVEKEVMSISQLKDGAKDFLIATGTGLLHPERPNVTLGDDNMKYPERQWVRKSELILLEQSYLAAGQRKAAERSFTFSIGTGFSSFFLFRLNHPAITQRICMKQLLLRQSQPNQQISPL